jgi:hypothetical protein
MALEMKYFVLKPAGVGTYAEASRRAMVSYAQAIRAVDKTMANDLLEWVEREEDVNVKRRIKGTESRGAM